MSAIGSKPGCTRRELLRLSLTTTAAFAGASLLGCRSATPRMSPSFSGIDASGQHSLRFAASGHGLLTGTAVAMQPLRHDPRYAQLLREQCSILVAENAMKRGDLQPISPAYFWDDADFLVAFAEQHRIKIRGHSFVWHEAIPKWLEAAINKDSARHLMVDHIQTVASRYAGRMHSWDVVNEAIAPEQGRPDGLRMTPWLRYVGDDYLEVAYRTARQADPAALLTYNEYGLDTESSESEQRRAATLLLLRRLKARNVPIDAMGIQAHLTAGEGNRYGQGLQRFIAECRALNLQVFITEIDVNDRALPGNKDARDESVAKTYRDYLNTVLPDPSVHAVLTWGITDRGTWLNGKNGRADKLPERPLPFDADLQPKLAFAAMREAFNHRSAHPAPTAPVQNYDPIRPRSI
ncbi:endo-1,4-beta-xylanase [Terriglobus saanensis]|uniref:Beta-xylanase n=1 Tax=Terriglobus saanensis (strain ATCC BAA-1853 / DSM 23119 / SP1PR4) TaxID=401053 RepID=E8V5N9_TERSS|nr:endo-1,4-beta-xylanase [Terriglobus saanensis]ADV82648.1 Endo-1,4-beta-xylanase [Terriglobus saanensis SP1PR4]